MILERVIGNTIHGKNGMTVDPVTGDLAYIAGCIVVFYRPKSNRQTQFLSSLNNRSINESCNIEIDVIFHSAGHYRALIFLRMADTCQQGKAHFNLRSILSFVNVE